jgi:membrane protein
MFGKTKKKADSGRRRDIRSDVKWKIAMGFVNRVASDHVGAYAAQAAYFMILSFIPFILFLTTLVRYTDISYNMLSQTIRSIVPQNLQGFVMELVSEVYNRNTAIVPVTVILALWSSGKMVQSLINGLNTIYHVRETRNWLATRVYSVFYTMLVGIAMLSSFLLLVLGNRLLNSLPPLGRIVSFLLWLASVTGARTLLVFAALFFIFLFLYKVLPNRPATLKSQVPGAAIIAVVWAVFSNLFSLYFKLFPSVNYMYGSLSTLIVTMLWLYFCMMLVLIGAAINAYFEMQFRIAHRSVHKILHEEFKDVED